MILSYHIVVKKMKIKPTMMTGQILQDILFGRPEAIAMIQSGHITGTVSFYPCFDGCAMIYEIEGLPENKPGGVFGFHIHEGSTCLNDTPIPYEKTGNHYNPKQTLHPYHLGDLPPLFANHGHAWAIIYIDKFHPQDVIGRTIVIHEHFDDMITQPSGNSGTKIACGEIKKFVSKNNFRVDKDRM